MNNTEQSFRTKYFFEQDINGCCHGYGDTLNKLTKNCFKGWKKTEYIDHLYSLAIGYILQFYDITNDMEYFIENENITGVYDEM